MAVFPWVCRRCTLRLLSGSRSSRSPTIVSSRSCDRRRRNRSYATAADERTRVDWAGWFDSAAPYSAFVSGAAAHDRGRKSHHGRACPQWAPSVSLRASFAPQMDMLQRDKPLSEIPKDQAGRAPLMTILPRMVDVGLRDVSWVRQNLDYPSEEDYPWAPTELFSTTSYATFRDAFELVRPDNLSVHGRYRMVRLDEECYWRYHLIAQWRDNAGDAIRLLGEGLSKSEAALSAYMQLVEALHTEQRLKRPDDALQREDLDGIAATGLASSKAVFDVYDFAAHFGVLPDFQIEDSSGGYSNEWHVSVSVQLPQGPRISGAASHSILDHAKAQACEVFKLRAENQLLHEEGPLDPRASSGVNLDTAPLLLALFTSQEEGSRLKKRTNTTSSPTGDLTWSVEYTLDGESLGPSVSQVAKDEADRLATLIAALELVRRHPHLVDNLQSARAHAHGFRILREPPIQAPSIDRISPLIDPILESLRRSKLTGTSEMPPDGSESSPSAPSGARALMGHFKHREYTHAHRVSYGSRCDNLQAAQEYFWYNPSTENIKTERSALPASQHRQQILSAVGQNEISIIVGATATGKSTQVPQMLLEDAISRGQGAYCNIVCTQPRRVAVQSLARRVADERDETLGDVVGYQISGEHIVSELGGSITYSTPEVQAIQLELNGDQVFDGISHYIIDEAHQRDRHSDHLLTLLKRVRERRKREGKSIPKIVVMSATLYSQEIRDYFDDEGNLDGDIPVIEVPGRLYHVRHLYLADVLEEFKQSLSELERNALLDRPRTRLVLADEAGTTLPKATNTSDVPEGQSRSILWSSEREAAYHDGLLSPSLIAATVAHILRSFEVGDILVFLPGFRTIMSTLEEIELHKDIVFSGVTDYEVHVLHSTTSHMLEKALAPSAPGQRRIFLATNIAETSLTFSNVSHVVDTGRFRDLVRHPLYGVDHLAEEWISKSSATQRAGRAGRVRSGHYYALYSKDRLKSFEPTKGLFPFSPVHLTRPALRALRDPSGGSVYDHFESDIRKPPASDIDAALADLQSIGALSTSNRLTYFGELVSNLPLIPRSGQLVLLGMMFSCLEPMLTIAISLNENQLFQRGWDEHSKRRALTLRQFYSRDTCSDHIALLNAYRELRQIREDHGDERAKDWAASSFIDFERFLALDRQVQTLPRLLKGFGLVSGSLDSFNQRANDYKLVAALTSAALYPNTAVRISDTNFWAPLGVPAQPAKGSVVSVLTQVPSASNFGQKAIGDQVFGYSSYQYVDQHRAKMLNISRLSPLALALFGGHQLQKDSKKGDVLVLDGWLPFQFENEHISDTMLELRAAWGAVWRNWMKEFATRRAAPGFQGSRDRRARDEFVQSVVDLLHLEDDQSTSPTFDANLQAALDKLAESRSDQAFEQAQGPRPRDAFDELEGLETGDTNQEALSEAQITRPRNPFDEIDAFEEEQSDGSDTRTVAE